MKKRRRYKNILIWNSEMLNQYFIHGYHIESILPLMFKRDTKITSQMIVVNNNTEIKVFGD